MFGGLTRYGIVDKHGGAFEIASLTQAPEEDLQYKLETMGATTRGLEFEPMALIAADLLPPVTPSKIICVGRNYREHVREMGSEMPTEPLLFFKPPSSLLRPGGAVRLPAVSQRVDFEGELALVIGRHAYKMSPTTIGARWCADSPLPTTSQRATCSRKTRNGRAPKASTRFVPWGRW